MQYAFKVKTIVNQISFHPQLSERMKVVDVLSTKVYNDSQQIIAQVTNYLLFVRSVLGSVFSFPAAVEHS